MAFDKNKNTIFVDMDGVLADFDRFVMERMGRTFSHIVGPGADREMWDFIQGVEDFFYLLEPTPYAKELWDAVKAVGCHKAILTAIPRRATMEGAEDQKRRWFPKNESIFGTNVDFRIGPFSRDKWKHAKPGDILIDDRVDNINDWATKGKGIGIYHVNITDTLALLADSVK